MTVCKFNEAEAFRSLEIRATTFKGLNLLAVSLRAQIDDVCDAEGLKPFNVPPTCDSAAKRQPLIYKIRLHPSRPLSGPCPTRL